MGFLGIFITECYNLFANFYYLTSAHINPNIIKFTHLHKIIILTLRYIFKHNHYLRELMSD